MRVQHYVCSDRFHFSFMIVLCLLAQFTLLLLIAINSFHFIEGKNLINEAEFLQWIQKMQNTINDGQEDSSSQQINNRFVENDDISEDLIAAFRYVIANI